MSQSNKVSTLWLKGRIRNIDHVCLASMVANDLDVSLYSYESVSNVPEGIKLKDANEILDLSLLDKLQCIKKKENNSYQPIVNFSDFFRIFLQKHEKGLWLDSDMFIFRPFTYDLKEVFFGYEGKGRIGSPVFYLPKDHEIISEYENLIKQDVLMPNWLGFKRGVIKPFWWKITGQDFSPPDLGITIYGNDGFTRLTKRYSCFNKALDKERFYALTGNETNKLFIEHDFNYFFENPNHLGIHIHRKHWERLPVNKNSFWEWALNKYGKKIEN